MHDELVVFMTLFILLAVLIFYYLKYRHTERMSIIENGVSEEQITFLLKTRRRASSGELINKFAVMIISIGFAILIGNNIQVQAQEAFIASLVFIFPGMGLLVSQKFFGPKADKA